MRISRSLLALLLFCAAALPAQTRTVTVAPDTLTLSVGDTARPLVAVRAGAGRVVPGAALSFSGAHSSVITAHRDGLITARGLGCTTWRARHSTFAAAQLAVCVVAAAPAPDPAPTPDPTPVPPPPSGALIFASDWSSGTVNDGGRWNNVYCPGSLVSQTLSVVDGAPLGWSKTPKVLRLRQLGESVCGMLEKTNAVPASTSHYGRFYFRNDETSTTHNHVATYNPVGDIQVAIWNRDASASGLTLFFRTYKSPGGAFAGWPYSYWRLPTRLQHGTWYRYEWHMEYVTATTYRLWPRVYDLAGTLIADANTYRDSDGGRTLAAHYASGATFGVTPSLARNFGLGNEGPAQSASTGGFWYHADVALSLTDWIGR